MQNWGCAVQGPARTRTRQRGALRSRWRHSRLTCAPSRPHALRFGVPGLHDRACTAACGPARRSCGHPFTSHVVQPRSDPAAKPRLRLCTSPCCSGISGKPPRSPLQQLATLALVQCTLWRQARPASRRPARAVQVGHCEHGAHRPPGRRPGGLEEPGGRCAAQLTSPSPRTHSQGHRVCWPRQLGKPRACSCPVQAGWRAAWATLRAWAATTFCRARATRSMPAPRASAPALMCALPAGVRVYGAAAAGQRWLSQQLRGAWWAGGEWCACRYSCWCLPRLKGRAQPAGHFAPARQSLPLPGWLAHHC